MRFRTKPAFLLFLALTTALAVRTDVRLSLQHPDERVELRVDGRAERAALRQLDVEDQPRRPELHG